MTKFEPNNLEKTYKSFQEEVAINTISLIEDNEEKVYQYYDSRGLSNNSTNEAIIMLHGVPGKCQVFYQQIVALTSRGYRVISVEYPPFWTLFSFCQGFHEFLNLLEIEKIHLFGLGFGGYLAMKYVNSTNDKRIKSLILCNSFTSTKGFSKFNKCGGMISWAPVFWLKRKLLKTFPQKNVLLPIAEAIDFMVEIVEKLDYEELASRITMFTYEDEIKDFDFDQKKVTVINSMDSNFVPRKIREKVVDKFPDCKYAKIKYGGDFPQLSNPQEINMHLIVHLRNNGWNPDNNTLKNQIESKNNKTEQLNSSTASSSSESSSDSEQDEIKKKNSFLNQKIIFSPKEEKLNKKEIEKKIEKEKENEKEN
ncbi:acid cluster protein [Anaeramoeba flamelloides]|uniref:Maspardin n=1 Tax=Anaeramoeba flamelloides TaxID=1746091 RepID=A0AAV7YUN2_9EUKA|nr:acid cluster protein [Anaeramoeba flamelloides]